MIKKWLGALFPMEEQRMSGATISIHGPFPSISYFYALESITKKIGLTGWIHWNQGTSIDLQLEGAHDALAKFADNLKNGTYLPGPPAVDLMWLPYKKQFTHLQIKVFRTADKRVFRTGDF